MKHSRLSRRALLQALTVGAGSLAFGAGPSVRSAWARSSSTPRRLVVFPNANGVPDMGGGQLKFGQRGSSPTDFTLGSIMAPVDTMGLRDQFVGIEGIEMRRPADGAFDTHFCGIAQLLTGPIPGANGNPGNFGIYRSATQSIDQYLASKQFASLPWPCLLMGALCDGVSYSHLADGTMVPTNVKPLDLYNKVFGNLMPGGPDPAALARLARRKSVLDHVARDLTTFKSRLPAEDRARADAQLGAIQQMESRLQSLAVSGACTKPTVDPNVDYAAEESLPDAMRAFIAITVAAFACDQTRLVVMHDFLSDGSTSNPRYGAPFAPVNTPGVGQHSLSHGLDDSPTFEGFQRMKAFNTQLACELAAALKAIPEPGVSGETMLDNTLIYMPTEIGRGHTPVGLQFATLGGKALGVKTGQYLKLSGDLDTPLKDCVPNQRMLVTLLNAMGVPDATFGEDPTLDTGSGPIAAFGTFG